MKKILLFIGLVVTNLLANAQQANVVIDPSFDIYSGSSSGLSDITSITLQQDGKILFGGTETNVHPVTFLIITKKTIFRLNNNGTKDTSFNAESSIDGVVHSIVLQPDGKILVGGNFTSYNGTFYRNLIRLNSDGSKDTSFNTGTINFSSMEIVTSIELQPDGKLLVGGNFTTYDGASQNGIIRLNSDGSKDTSFNIGFGFGNDGQLNSGLVESIVLQPDGKILVGGNFITYNGNTQIQNRLIRLNSNGSKDTFFNIGTGFNGRVLPIVLQTDGKILVGGAFNTYNGISQNQLIRLNNNGSEDVAFNSIEGIQGAVSSIKIQPDSKILVGGTFQLYNGTTQNKLIRLNSNGTKDPYFNIGSGFTKSALASYETVVKDILLQPDGKILFNGKFEYFNGTPTSIVGRLEVNSSYNPNPNNYLATYPFNGNTNDESGNNYHATNNGAVLTTDRLGNTNKAYDFNGTSNYIQFPSAIGTAVTTVSMWFKPTSSQDNQIVLRNRMYGYEIAYNKVYDGIDRANKLSTKLYINNSSGGYNEYTYIHPSNLNLNQWYHIAFTYDGNYYKVYLDNVMVYQSNSFGTGTVKYENSGAGYVIGRDGDTPYWYFKGSIDDLSVWGQALSDSELNTIYTGGILNSTDFENSKSLILYPNPVRDILYIKIPENISIINCELFDLTGKMIKVQVFNNGLDVSQIQKGMYLIKLDTSEGILTKKFIKE